MPLSARIACVWSTLLSSFFNRARGRKALRGWPFMVAGGLFVAFTRVAASAADLPSWPQSRSDLAADPDTTWGVLDNGLRYAVRSNAEPKGKVTLRLVILAGSLRETDAQRGLAHFVEHMAFNGTERFPRDTLIGVLQRHGMAFGADLNAFTFPTHTIYQIEAPTNEPALLEEGFTVLREFASRITFDPAEVVRERAVIESERRARDNWQYRREDARTRFLYPGTLYSERAPIGLPEIVLKANAPSLRAFYQTWYRPDNAVFIAVGDAPRETLEKLVRDQFSSWTAPATPIPPLPDMRLNANPSTLTANLQSDDIGSGLSMEVISAKKLSPQIETRDLRRLEFERDLVMTMMQERLNQLRRRNASVFGAGFASDHELINAFRETSLGVSTAGVSWQLAVFALGNEWERARKLGFTSEEIRAAGEIMRRRFDYARRAAKSQDSPEIAARIVSAVLNDAVYSNWDQQWAELEPIITTLTPERAHEVFLDLWSPGQPRIFASGNLQLTGADIALTDAFVAGRDAKLAPPPRPEPVKLDYAPAATPGAIKHRSYIADLNLHLIEFANGIRVDLKPLDTQQNLISVRARVGWGQLTQPAAQGGLGLLANSYVDDAGVGRHLGDDLQRYYAEHNLSLNFHSEEDAFTFTGSSDQDNALQLLTVLTAYLNDPAWRPDSFVGAMRKTLGIYSDAAHEPAAAVSSLAARVMTADDRRFALPPPDVIFRRQHGELMTWLEESFKGQPVEIGLVGDFDVEKMVDAAARTLGTLPPRSAERPLPNKKIKPVAYATKPGRWQTFVESNIPRAVVRSQWPVTGCGDIHARRNLEVLAGLLTERIRKEIRQKQGFTYDADAEVWNGITLRDDGYVIVTLSVPPAEAQAISLKIVEQAQKLATNGATQDELDAVVKPLLAENKNRLRETGYWLFYIASLAQEEPQRLDWPRTREADYKNMQLGAINQLARNFLDAKRAQIFVARPQTTTPAQK